MRLYFEGIPSLCHISPSLFCPGEIWQYSKLILTVVTSLMESTVTPLIAKYQIRALPEYAPRFALGIAPAVEA